MQSLFTFIYDFFAKRPVLYWCFFVLLFAVCILGASRIRFENDINAMIPHDPSIEAMNDVLNKTKTGEQIIFTVSFKDTTVSNPDSLIQQQQRFQDELAIAGKGYIKNIQAQINDEKEQQFSALALQYLPLFLEEKDYDQIDSLIQPERIKETLVKEHNLLLSPAGMVAKQWIAQDPVGIVPIAFQKLQALQFDPGYALYNGYIFSKDGKRLTFFLDLTYPASETGKNAALFQKTDKLLATWNKQYPGLHISYFGGPAVAAGNAVQMRSDTILTLSITVVLLLALTFYVFRRKRSPLILMVPVVFGAIFGLAIMALIQGSVSIIALGAGAIILGIAIDFSVHFMSHARIHPDMRENVRTLVSPLTLGALTTVGAFLALRLANAPLLQDLGLFAAASLTGASLFTLIFLPHLLKERKTKDHKEPKPNIIDKLAMYRPEGNKWLLITVIVATPVLWYFAGKVQFDGDLMHLNYLSPEMKAAQDELNQHNAYALSSIFVVAKDKNEEAAAQKLESAKDLIQQLKQQGKIRNNINPVLLLPSEREQEIRIQRWQNFWNEERVNSTLNVVAKEATAAGFSADAFDGFAQILQEKYTPFDKDAKDFLKQLFPNAINEKDGAHYVIASLKIEPDARKEVLKALEGNKQIIATDKQSVSERLLDLLKKDFNKILLYSGALVFLALLIAYGRIELALISFLPMALTWVWILGIMSLIGLKFNIVNIIISTLIFGLGDDYSIFMMDSLLEKYRTGKNNISAARSAVYLSVMTTIIGLGTLIFAKHPALQSIAAIAILGLVCVVFVSQVLQPFLFNFMIQRRADKGFMPFTLWSLIKSAFSFIYFFTGCLLVTLAGFILVGLRPFGKARSKYMFHYFLSKYTGSVMYIMGNVKKRIVKLGQVDFKEPAVYIANHSSFLDILITTMLHPKLVLLTNKWVWRSPAFGKIVRMAEYYPVADGAEDSIEPLRDLVQRGYGIIVFPEGTRSYDDMIHRFHKGAFYIAEELQLDVVPLVLHGVHYAMQKGDWLLKDGIATIKIYPHIKPDDTSYGAGYRERTKGISRYFKQEFQKEKELTETPKYFKEQIIKANMYKGPVLEWYCRVKIALENYYEPFHKLLPRAGRFYDLGCGYGFMTYMLHWASEERIFTGVDYDEDKIITAQHNYLREKAKKLHYRKAKAAKQTFVAEENDQTKINFEQADVTQYELQSCNGIIISDVLHYLLPEQQEALLNKCFNALEPGGILIVRDGVEELKERHEGTKRTEVLSTRIFNFNKTQNELHFISRAFIEHWAAAHNMSVETLDLTKKTSNVIFVLRK
ncbi:MAG: 1-acyl-sn-glycerol-3-phosphate acyltransferase [Taibaiella sp.]|jgi:1-acyl-sn-glycerol-3-phosphate acyltransferase